MSRLHGLPRPRRGVGVLLAALLLAGCDQPADPVQEIRPVRSQVLHYQAQTESPRQVGDIRPHFESDLGFKISGRVLSRLNQLGVTVKRGEEVARLDEQDQRNQWVAAGAELAAAKASLVQAAAEEKRQRQLRQDGWSTQAQYDAALQARDSAQANVNAAQAKLRLAQDQLSYAVLRAPEDGVISALGAEAGQVVAAGQMILRLARLDQKDAVFSLAENTLLNAPPHPVVDVWLLDNPQIRTNGTVTEISPSADPVTRTYTVKVALPDAPAAMRLGMSVAGRIRGTERRAASLPVSALFQRDGQPALWVVDSAAQTVSLVKVGLLRLEPDRVLVADGLPEGARVVTAGVQKLVPGQKVRLDGESAP